jgi:hypothetical protein
MQIKENDCCEIEHVICRQKKRPRKGPFSLVLDLLMCCPYESDVTERISKER